MQNGLTAIILAAGKSRRMKSDMPKVLHEICGKHVISYALDLCLKLKIKHIIVVAGWGKEKVLRYVRENYKGRDIEIAVQAKMLGTAHAVLSAKNKIRKTDNDLLILYGDQPLLSLGAAQRIIKKYRKEEASCVLLTADLEEPAGYGRIIRDKNGKILEIREDNDLSREEKNIKEVNAGSCVFKKEKLFRLINKIRADNKKGEYYLTDAVRLLYQEGEKILSVKVEAKKEALGINSRLDLIGMENIMRVELNNKFLAEGVTIRSPETTFINQDVKIGRDTVVNPFVYIGAGVRIGKNCSIGPFAYIRGESVIKDNTIIGSFGELNRSVVGRRSRIKHFCYLGDAEVGNNVNVGAGTVTANYDGKFKHKTYIKDRAFIGSDTVLVAPVSIGRSAVTGAGSVVTKHKNVPDGGIVFGVPAKKIPARKKWIK